MPARRLVRALYSWASGLPALERPLGAVRSHPRVRAYARRHVPVLLAPGTTWANVDGALRLLAEEPGGRIVFGRWPGDAATELLYWAPFVRWARERFALEPSAVTVLGGGDPTWFGAPVAAPQEKRRVEAEGASLFPAAPVAGLVEEYRRGAAAPRPLLKRARHVPLAPPAADSASGPDSPYVAVDLAPSPAFPDTPANRAVAADLAETLSAASAVVALRDSQPWPVRHRLLAGAAGVVCAYSATALLAAFSGSSVVALRSADGEVAEPDLDLAARVAGLAGGSLTILDAADLASLRRAIAG